MSYLIFQSKEEAEAAQAVRDKVLGYPEPLSNLRWVGKFPHCPLEYGRALHYMPIEESKDKDKWAIYDVKSVDKEASAVSVDELPEDWREPFVQQDPLNTIESKE